MGKTSSKRNRTHSERKAPARFVEDKTLTELEKKLVEDLELSEVEFERYKKLPPYKKAEIIHLLTERKRLNSYVNHHLQEQINKQPGPLWQFFLPSENDLKYALQKVDEIETIINEQVGKELHVFDKDNTKKNRLETLLITAHIYQDTLDKKIAKELHTPKKGQIESLQRKRDSLAKLIEELHTQRELSEFFIHDEDILSIKDSELGYFINKLKTIGIEGLVPKASKFQFTFFNLSILTTLIDRLNPIAEKGNDETPESTGKHSKK